MKIGFVPFHLSERGTTTAVYDYAYYNEKLLGNKSIIFYEKDHPLNFNEYETKFNNEFECYPYNKFSEIDEIVKRECIDALYLIKYGSKDDNIVINCPNLIHSVFVGEPHGEKYAFVSRFLSEKYENKIPYIPHMINLPKTNENLRDELNIPKDALVFGGLGGKNSFDIAFVHKCIDNIINETPNIYFLFMNFNQNTNDHPRIIYMKPTIDKLFKVKFINTCDAMIHARSMGETFGLACGEFSTCNKPVITYLTDNKSYDKEHIRILGSKGLYYNDEKTLLDIFRKFKKDDELDFNCYKDYEPIKVMRIFEKVFLNIVTCKYDNKIWTLCQNDGISKHILNSEGWEPHLTSAFKKLIKLDDVVIDIGANFGYHTMTMAECVGNNGKVYAYEPQKYIYNLLLRNIKNNNVTDIVIPQKIAVMDEDKVAQFTQVNWLADNQNMGDSYITNNIANTDNVLCQKLDNLNFDKVNLIKLDVQGSEVLCLEGMVTLIKTHQPYMIIEIEEYTLNRFGYSSKKLIDTIINMNYTIYYIEYRYPSDHLCVPNSKIKEFNDKYSNYISINSYSNNINNNLEHGVNLKINFNLL